MEYLVKRFVAYYIDLCVVSVLYAPYYFGRNDIFEVREEVFLVAIIVQIAYFGLLEYFFDRTIGKKLLKFKVEFDEDKTLLKVFVRTLLRILPFEPFSIFLNKEHSMWHDQLSGSRVVKL